MSKKIQTAQFQSVIMTINLFSSYDDNIFRGIRIKFQICEHLYACETK
jgi:hypothetical protein